MRKPFYINVRAFYSNSCLLTLKNRTGERAYIVLHDVANDSARELSFRRSRRLKLPKGTYVIEAWLRKGNIGINPENIQHVKIENIPAKHYTSFRGKRIVADLNHDRELLILFEEITVGDIIQRGN
ncbi:MAG: hypothetical protein JXR52_06645 [Bacteroidales bacterium]|nr:hypothetical protein [Bacteroidales bacterium]MBN2698488.1 hypothetical protein [Bacteroidales bacterium]